MTDFNNWFRKSCLFLSTWNIKKLFILFSDYNSFIHEQALDVINNLCWKKDDWVAAVYDNEWYPGVVCKVGWILAYITDNLLLTR